MTWRRRAGPAHPPIRTCWKPAYRAPNRREPAENAMVTPGDSPRLVVGSGDRWHGRANAACPARSPRCTGSLPSRPVMRMISTSSGRSPQVCPQRRPRSRAAPGAVGPRAARLRSRRLRQPLGCPARSWHPGCPDRRWDKETCSTPAGPEGLLRGPARASALWPVLSPDWPRSPHHGPAARRARRRSMPPW